MPLETDLLPARPLLRDSVLHRLRDAIVDGSLAPDEQLRDVDLAARLGVSRTPVREALLELTRAGLVRAVPGRSTVVAPIDIAAVRNAQAVVGAMHALAVRTAVPRMSAAHLDAMRVANERFRAAWRAGDAAAAHAADAQFHDVALQLAENTALTAVLAQYEPVLHRVERLRFGGEGGGASAARHDQLIERCAAGDVDGAAAVAEQIWKSLTTEHHPRTDNEEPA